MSSKFYVLLVDDVIAFSRTLKDILELKGYAVGAVATYEEALAHIRTNPPAVALIDLFLEGASGIQLIETIKSHYSTTECILLTGYASQDSAIEAVNLGVFGYLEKPCDIQQLMLMVERAIEKQVAALALRESEERFRRVVSSISDHIYSAVVAPNGTFLNQYHSPGIEEITGYPLDQLVTRDHWARTFIYPDDLEILESHIQTMLDGQHSESEYRLVCATGDVIWVRDSAKVEATDDQLVAYGVVSDITERKMLEEQLLHSQKMEAMGRFAGGIAHDFNNALMIIDGYTSLVYKVCEGSNERLEDYIVAIRRASNHASSLIDQLLAFSRQQVLETRSLSLNDVAAGISNMLAMLMPKSIELTLELRAEEGFVEADPGKLEQVIINLAVNARDAMADGGRLLIQTSNVVIADETATINGHMPPGDYLKLLIADSGHGMDEDTQQKIFEPFFTTKALGVGTGLGLSMVHGIVEQSGYFIDLTSAVGQGTTFTIYLPEANSPDVHIERSPADDIEPQSVPARETILLVEDDETICMLISDDLREQGYTVIEAQDSVQVNHFLTSTPTPINLLLTDFNLAGGSGSDVARCVLKSHPNAEVLFMSGLPLTPDDIIREDNFIQKPFDLTTLSLKIHQILGHE